MKTPFSRVLPIAALLAAASVLTGPPAMLAQESGGPEMEPESSPEGFGRNLPNFVTWNVFQGAGHDGALTPTTRFSSRIVNSTRLPRAVAAQEICRRGFQNMRLFLQDYGYQGAFRPSNSNATSCAVDPDDDLHHGNAIFWRGGSDNNPVAWDYFEDQRTPPENDRRLHICAQSNGGFIACSAHMTPNAPAVARLQITQYRQISEYFKLVIGIDTISMGDFNEDSAAANVGVQPWYQHHREADGCGNTNGWVGCTKTHDVRTSLTRKLDYIFATKGPGFCERVAGPSFYESATHSDHRLVRGYFAC